MADRLSMRDERLSFGDLLALLALLPRLGNAAWVAWILLG